MLAVFSLKSKFFLLKLQKHSPKSFRLSHALVRNSQHEGEDNNTSHLTIRNRDLFLDSGLIAQVIQDFDSTLVYCVKHGILFFHQVAPVGVDPSQQYTGDTIPNLMGEPVLAGGMPPSADPGMFGQTVQPIAQQQEVFVPPVQQPQGMVMPAQPQPGPRPGLPQMVGHESTCNAFYLVPFLTSANQSNLDVGKAKASQPVVKQCFKILLHCKYDNIITLQIQSLELQRVSPAVLKY